MKVIKKRVASRNPKVQMLTLELLGQAVEACGLPLHTQVSSKDSIVILSSLVKNRETDAEVKARLTALVQRWGVKFQDSQDILPGFSELYNSLRQAGVSFGQAEAVRSEPLPQAVNLRPIAPASTSTSQRLPSQKLEKLKSDLNVVRENVKVTNEMIDASEPGPAASRNEVLTELTNTLKAMQGKLAKLIESVGDDELVGLGIAVKDEVDAALGKYQELKEGRRAPAKPPVRQAQPASFLDMDLELPSGPKPAPVERPREPPPSNSLPFDIFGSSPAPAPVRATVPDTITFPSPQVPTRFTESRPVPAPSFEAVFAPPPAQPIYQAPPPQTTYSSFQSAPAPAAYSTAPAYGPPLQAPPQPVVHQPRVKHNMGEGMEEGKKSENKPKDLFDDLVQL